MTATEPNPPEFSSVMENDHYPETARLFVELVRRGRTEAVSWRDADEFFTGSGEILLAIACVLRHPGWRVLIVDSSSCQEDQEDNQAQKPVVVAHLQEWYFYAYDTQTGMLHSASQPETLADRLKYEENTVYQLLDDEAVVACLEMAMRTVDECEHFATWALGLIDNDMHEAVESGNAAAITLIGDSKADLGVRLQAAEDLLGACRHVPIGALHDLMADCRRAMQPAAVNESELSS